MQHRRLSRAARELCRKHAWNARSKQRHVPDAKQVLLWKGWVLKQRLSDVHVHCCASTREIPATWISIRTQCTEKCSCDKTAALACHNHTWISLRAQKDMFRQKNCCVPPRAHLDLFPCANRHVNATTLLHLHAVSTPGSSSVRKETCSGEKTAAFARREHS